MTRPEIELQSPGPLANTLPLGLVVECSPMGRAFKSPSTQVANFTFTETIKVNANKWLIFVLEYFERFNSVQTIVILVYKQIISDLFKNKITYKLLTQKSYV